MQDNGEILSEMSSLATRVRAEAELMRVATRRQAIVYVVLGVIIAGYLSWAYRRAAQYIDAEAQAQNTGEQAIKRSMELVYEATGEARASAPKVVRGVETSFVTGIGDMGKQLTVALRDKPRVTVKNSLVAWDIAFVAELAKLPDARKRVAALAARPSDAARLTNELRPKILARPEMKEALAVPTALAEVRDHIRHLADTTALTAQEQVERSLLQTVYAGVNPAGP